MLKEAMSDSTFNNRSRIYLAASCATQVVWLQIILSELKNKSNSPTTIYCDNKPAIVLTKNSMFHSRSKHIDIKYHYIQDLVKDKEIMVKYC